MLEVFLTSNIVQGSPLGLTSDNNNMETCTGGMAKTGQRAVHWIRLKKAGLKLNQIEDKEVIPGQEFKWNKVVLPGQKF